PSRATRPSAACRAPPPSPTARIRAPAAGAARTRPSAASTWPDPARPRSRGGDAPLGSPRSWAEGPTPREGNEMTEINGTCAPGFEAVRDAFAANFDQGNELGASACVTLRGETVVDLWGGDRDQDGTPWERDTIVNV